MPKKFVGENSKAVAAKARKEAVMEEAKQKKAQAEADALWTDDDKLVARKQQRKEEKDKKKNELLQKKAEAKAILEAETGTIGASSAGPSKPTKLTRAQITDQQERAKAVASAEKPKVKTHLDEPLEENINRLHLEGETARSVDEAISVLTGKDDAGDRHPERRMKAAYADFETARLPILKVEHPNMRLSQLKQLLHKEWLKSPENPMNQKIMSYNSK